MVRIIIVILIVLIPFLKAFSAGVKDYCPHLPPFLQQNVPVNILFILQDDGRMRWLAYQGSYDSSKIYRGYFDHTKNYKYNWNEKAYVETTDNPQSCPPRPQGTSDFPLKNTESISGGKTKYTLTFSVLPYSLKIFKNGDNTVLYKDDGNGKILKCTSSGCNSAGTIDYSGKTITFSSNLKSGNYTVNYTYILDGVYSGSCLNYHYMTRIDVVRRIFTGGSPRSCPTSQTDITGVSEKSKASSKYCDFRENTVDVSGDYYYLKFQVFEDWDDRWSKGVCVGVSECIANYTYNAPVVKVSKTFYNDNMIQNFFVNKKDKFRLGLVVYDTANPVIHPNKVYLGDYRTSENDADTNKPYRNFVTSLNANRDLFTAEYDGCKTANIWDAGNSMAPALWDVYNYFAQKPSQFCGFKKNYSTDYWRDPFYVKINNNWQFVPCIKNYMLILGEGMWNIGVKNDSNLNYSCNIDDGYSIGLSSDPTVPIDTLKNKGFTRNNQTFKIDKVFSVAVYPNYDYGKNSMKWVAWFGSGNTGSYPNNTCDLSSFNSNLKNCKGSLCTSLNQTLSNYFEASDFDSLKNAIYSSIQAIISESSSGSSVAGLSQKDTKGALVSQAVFYPQKNIGNYKVDWAGQVFEYWFLNTKTVQNIREDTDGDKILNILNDKILQFQINDQGKLQIDYYSSDSNGNPTTKDGSYTSLDDTKYLWEAGYVLKDINPDNRIIYSVAKDNTLKLFTSANKDSFDTLLGTDPSDFPNCLKTGSTINYGNLIDYIRGKDIEGCRSRQADSKGNIWKLGDIIYSSPKTFYYPDYGIVLFTASNDGMLHAFYAGKVYDRNDGNNKAELTGTDLGKELWAFIPKNALPYLRYLADPNYCHIYIHDLSPYIYTTDNKVVLIGGLRLGGACSMKCNYDPNMNNCSNPVNPPTDTCPDSTDTSKCVGLSEYYALDITDPKNPKLLWEFTHSDLGFSFSGPGIIKTKDNKYHVVFGSGPVNYTAQFANNENFTLKLFVVNLDSGELERKIDTGIKKAFAGRIFSEGLDIDGDGYTDYLAVGYTRQDGGYKNFKGGVLLLGGTKDGNSLRPFSSDISNWNYLDYSSLGTDVGPVTAKVEFMKCFDKWYMYVGTGRWFVKEDNWEVNKNTIFGIPVVIKNDTSGKYVDLDTGTQDVTDESHVDNICTQAQNNIVRGWYINLDPGEKIVTDPTITDSNLIIFTSIKPNQDICGMGGDTRVWTLNCATGSKPSGCSNGLFAITDISGSILLQLSGSDIRQINLNTANSRSTNWYKGIAPENAPPLISYKQTKKKGEIILWIER